MPWTLVLTDAQLSVVDALGEAACSNGNPSTSTDALAAALKCTAAAVRQHLRAIRGVLSRTDLAALVPEGATSDALAQVIIRFGLVRAPDEHLRVDERAVVDTAVWARDTGMLAGYDHEERVADLFLRHLGWDALDLRSHSEFSRGPTPADENYEAALRQARRRVLVRAANRIDTTKGRPPASHPLAHLLRDTAPATSSGGATI